MIGQMVSHYRILEKLGQGGMGIVYKAEDTKLRRMVAVKWLPTELTRDEEAKKRLLREARAASALEHNNICNIHAIEETEDGQIFIVMAFYPGETLKEKIDRGPVPVDEFLDLAFQISEGLREAHAKNIVHRDIKSSNIMVTVEGQVKIMDFGLAHAVLAKAHARLVFLRQDLYEERIKMAEKAAQRSLELAGQSPEVHLALYYYYLWAYRDTENAVHQLQIAEKDLPNNVEVLRARAALSEPQGKWQEYLAALEKAFTLSPRDASIVTDLALGYWLTAFKKLPRYETLVEQYVKN